MSSPLLSLKNVSLTVADSGKQILSSINYDVYPGDFLILLGSNGSGKSSLLKLIERRYQPSSGEIYFGHQHLSEIPDHLYYRQVKSLTQNTHDTLFTSLTVYENYLLVSKHREINHLLRSTQNEREFLADYLYEFNPNLAASLDQVTMHLSGGEKQALALALTVLTPPKVLLLDEHTSALDPKSAESIMEMTQRVVSAYNITCILTTHDLNIAKQYGTRILSIKNGRLHQEINEHDKSKFTSNDLLTACY